MEQLSDEGLKQEVTTAPSQIQKDDKSDIKVELIENQKQTFNNQKSNELIVKQKDQIKHQSQLNDDFTQPENEQINEMYESGCRQLNVETIQDNSNSQNKYQEFPEQESEKSEVNINQNQIDNTNDQNEQNNHHQQQNNNVQGNQERNQDDQEENMTEAFDQFQDHNEELNLQKQVEVNYTQSYQKIKLEPEKQSKICQIQRQNNQVSGQKEITKQIQIKQQKQQIIAEEKQKIIQQEKLQKKKQSRKEHEQEVEPLPIISQETIKKQENKNKDNPIPVASGQNSNKDNKREGDKKLYNKNNKKNQALYKIQQRPMKRDEPQVSQIIEPSSVAANVIIFEAQKERIATVLQYFNQFVNKHEKNIKNQKQLIKNISDDIQKKKNQKQAILNVLKDYFNAYASISKEFYEKSYKFTKSDKIFTLNPLINMKEELKSGIDQLIFLRKSTGNQFHRLSDFILNTIEKSLFKAFTEYWTAINSAQNKHKQKREEFLKKQKQFSKRINKIDKVYTRGRMGIAQDEDLFIQMTKFINQQKQYRKILTEYGLGLIPLKKIFIKAEESLFEELQIVLNNFKNQTRNVYSLHKNQFTLIQKFEKQIKENNTFQKLCDLMDSDYIRSVLLTHEKKSFPTLTDKDFEKIFNMLHFETVVGNSCDLLKGTTSKSFDLKTKYEQVVDTISGNLLIFNKQTSQMKEKFVMSNLNAKIVSEGVVEIDEVVKGVIFDSNKTIRLTFRDNDRAEELICFLNQIQQSQAQGLKNKK